MAPPSKMASSAVVLCNRTSGKSSRIRLEEINLKIKVEEFRSISACKLELSPQQFELVYCGKRLQDDHTLEFYGIRPGSTVHALRCPLIQEEETPEKLDNEAIRQVTTALQAALINPAFRHAIERMLNDSEALENIVAATPGLDRDPVAIGILRCPELLAALADPAIVNKVIEAHPTLGHAATLVAAAVNEEGTKSGRGGPLSVGPGGSYSLDQMSDDEDMESVVQSGLGSGGAAITASQLAAALATTGGAGPPIIPGADAGPSGENSSSSAITADFFQQAMMQATSSALSQQLQSSQPSSSGSSNQPVVTEGQLQQLRDMGIADEGLARRALEATGGDIQAALELIFGDGI